MSSKIESCSSTTSDK